MTSSIATRALVVGGTSGIGYAMACRVAASSPTASVIISGRTKPKDIPHINIDFWPIEATSMREIKKLTDKFKQQQQTDIEQNKLDFLIMTQGIMTMAGRTETSEGIDRKMALHYYGKQLLIRELLPALKDDAKVVIVYDSKIGNPHKLIWDDLDLKTHFSLGNAANNCMVMNDIMIQYHAARQQKQPQPASSQTTAAKRHFIHAWPGGVNTGLMRELPWYLSGVAKVLAPLVTVSPDTCAEHLLNGVQMVSTTRQDSNHWAYIDNKGKVIKDKALFSEEQTGRVADHTWKLIDQALA
ncbi:hypothetical protein CC79DRAFT_1371801 [Sarocladium strictum]